MKRAAGGPLHCATRILFSALRAWVATQLHFKRMCMRRHRVQIFTRLHVRARARELWAKRMGRATILSILCIDAMKNA